MRRLLTGLLRVALVLAAAVNAPSWLQYAYAGWGRAHVELPQAAGPGSGERVLVLAPHPDDEVLCCGGLIRRALDAGAEVYVAWMTSGDGFEMDELVLRRGRRVRPEDLRTLGERRMREARAAAAELGVPQANLFFLGYPDRGLRHLFLENFYVPYRSPYTRLEAVAYPGTLRRGGALHRGSAGARPGRRLRSGQPHPRLPALAARRPPRSPGHRLLRAAGGREAGAGRPAALLDRARGSGMAAAQGVPPAAGARARTPGQGSGLAPPRPFGGGGAGQARRGAGPQEPDRRALALHARLRAPYELFSSTPFPEPGRYPEP